MTRIWIRFRPWGQTAIANVIHARSRSLCDRTLCGRPGAASSTIEVLRHVPVPGEICMMCARHPALTGAAK